MSRGIAFSSQSYPVSIILRGMAIETLIFDLDDTLYPPATGIWDAIGVRINQFIQQNLNLSPDEVSRVRDELFQQYGTTLRGLQIVYGVDPYQYLNYVHNIPLEDYLQPNPKLRRILSNFDTRMTIFTNADQNHAYRVLERLDLAGIFERIIDIMDVAPYCKPQPEAFHRALNILGNPDPSSCIIIEDSQRNVVAAREIGFHTILVGEHNGRSHEADAWVASLEELASLSDLPLLQDIWRKS